MWEASLIDKVDYAAWQQPLEAALQENNPERLTELVRDADGAIFARMLSLPESPDGQDELRAIEDACEQLLIIKTEKLKWPSPFST